MSDDECKKYIANYIKTRVKINSHFLKRLKSCSREDVLYDLFLDLYERRHKYKPELAGFSTYAFTRTRYVVNKKLKESTKFKTSSGGVSPGYSICCHQKHVDDQDEISYMLGLLDSETGRMVKMKFIDEMTYSDISKNVNRKESYVRFRIRKALKDLKGRVY